MSRCAYGSVVFWLLTMLFTGASFCLCNVRAEDHVRNGPAWGFDADWRDWFMDEATRPASSVDSSLLVRRITPKSVFVAPSLSGCSEGYRQDGMGRCVKLVKVNQAAQLDFILQKLNSKFAPMNNKNNDKDDSGPFHVNIPLSFSSGYKVTKEENPAQNLTKIDTLSEDKEQVKTETPILVSQIIAGTNVDGVKIKTTPADSSDSDTEILIDGNSSFDGSEINVTTESLISVLSNNQSDHSIFESAIKRQPDSVNINGNRPFVIVVANSTDTNDYQAFGHTDRDQTTEEPVSDVTPKTTTDFGAPNAMTTTDAVFFSNQNYADKEVTTTEVYNSEYESTVDTTPVSITVSTVETNRRPTFVDMDTEVPTVSPFSLFESSKTEVDDVFTSSIRDDAYTSSKVTTIRNLSVDELEKKEKTANKNKIVVHVSSEVEKENLNGEEYVTDEGQLSEKHVYTFQDNKDVHDSYVLPTLPVPLPPQEITEPTTNCENLPSLQATEVSYGRIINPIPVGNKCKPAEVTSARYPVWTTTPRPLPPYYIRFPTDDVSSKPSFSYSTSPQSDGHKKNSFIRFPERPSISSPYHPLPYGSKIWSNSDGDGMSSSATSSGSWYSPPSSWFPLFQSQKTWADRYNPHLHYENNMNRPVPVSTMFRKQYHNYRPNPSSHIAPPWVDKRFPWPQRD